MIHKHWKYFRFIVIPAVSLLLCGILYTIIDSLSMGVIADWLDRTFAYESSTIGDDGTLTIIRNYDWHTMKVYLFQGIMAAVLLGSWIWILVSDFRKQAYQRKAAHDISEYMNWYILQDKPLPTELPAEYSEIFVRISEVCSVMHMREQLLRTESQRKNDLITYLAHDLKTPLTSVIGYLTLLHDEAELPEAFRTRYTQIAYKKALRLEELTEELFEITRFNLSRIELQKENVNLSRMAEQIAHEFLPLFKEKNLRLSLETVPEAVCFCDVDKMERVIDNLIRNAVSYSYPDSEIRITVQKTETTVILQFRNHGRTIPKEKIDRIFEQFFRLDASRSSKTGGTGLGLAIARQLIEAHDGSIQAESENETIQFTVTLPADRQKIV